MDRQRSRYSREFYDTHAEIHRRRPSSFQFPAVTRVVALWHPKLFRDNFQSYCQRVFEYFLPMTALWAGGIDDGSAARLAERLYSIYHFVGIDEIDDSSRRIVSQNERLVFDFKDHRFSGVNWRVEVQREYIVVVIFAALRLSTHARLISAEALAAPGASAQALATPGASGSAFSRSFNVEADGGHVTDVIFSTDNSDAAGDGSLESAIDRLMEAFLTHLDGWEVQRRVSPAEEEALGEDAMHKVFASFFGCVAPWTLFAGHIRKREDEPYFPDEKHPGFDNSSAVRLSEKLAATDRFLSSIWDDLRGNFLGGSRSRHDMPEVEGEDVIGQSCVGCYLQNGHVLYISSLGVRDSPEDLEPLRYLVLYQDAPEWEVQRGPTAKRSGRDGLDTSWRLSRLVGRLHDVGVTRLAALRRGTELKNFGQYLAHAEAALQRFHPSGWAADSSQTATQRFAQELKRIREGLFKRAQEFRESVMGRSVRAGLYFENMKVLAADLAPVTVPGWQSYDQFIRRRLYPTLNELSGIALRYERTLRTINTLQQMGTALQIEETLNEHKIITGSIEATAKAQAEIADRHLNLEKGAGLGAVAVLAFSAAEIVNILGRPDKVRSIMTSFATLLYVIAAVLIFAAIIRAFARSDDRPA